MVLEGSFGVMRIEEVVLPEVGPRQVLLQVYAAGVSHVQLRQVAEMQSQPRLMGEEAVCLVMEAGPGVTHVAPGDVVVVSPLASSGDPAGKVSIELEDGTETVPTRLFTFATNVVIDAGHVYRIDRPADREVAAILGSTVAGGAGAVLESGLGSGASAAIFGASGTGLAAIEAARNLGAQAIIVVDRSDKRLAIATKLGATETINATTDAANARIRELAPGGVAFLFDCVDDYRTQNRPARVAVADRGVTVLLGTPGTGDDAERMKTPAKAGGYVLPGAPEGLLPTLISWLAAGKLSLSAIATNRYTIEAVNEAVRDLENGDVVGQAIIVMEPLE